MGIYITGNSTDQPAIVLQNMTETYLILRQPVMKGIPLLHSSSAVGYEDIFEALDIQDELQTLYTWERYSCLPWGTPWQGAAKLVRTIAKHGCHACPHRLIPCVAPMGI